MNATNRINRLVAKKLSQGNNRAFCQVGRTPCGYQKAICVNRAFCNFNAAK